VLVGVPNAKLARAILVNHHLPSQDMAVLVDTWASTTQAICATPSGSSVAPDGRRLTLLFVIRYAEGWKRRPLPLTRGAPAGRCATGRGA
jgi:hypothetical protein